MVNTHSKPANKDVLDSLDSIKELLKSREASGAVSPTEHDNLTFATGSEAMLGMEGVIPECMLRLTRKYISISATDFWHCKDGHKGPRPEGYKLMKNILKLLCATFCELGTSIVSGNNKEAVPSCCSTIMMLFPNAKYSHRELRPIMTRVLRCAFI